MRKKRFIVASSVLVFICFVLGTLWMLPAHRAVTESNLDRIEAGMTNAEVSAIFGQADSGDNRWSLVWDGDGDVPATWHGDDGFARVHFDHAGRVTRAVWIEISDDRTFAEKMLDRLLRRERQRPGGFTF